MKNTYIDNKDGTTTLIIEGVTTKNKYNILISTECVKDIENLYFVAYEDKKRKAIDGNPCIMVSQRSKARNIKQYLLGNEFVPGDKVTLKNPDDLYNYTKENLYILGKFYNIRRARKKDTSYKADYYHRKTRKTFTITIDKKNLDLITDYKWTAYPNDHRAKTNPNSVYFARSEPDKRSSRLHIEIAKREHKLTSKPAGKVVDHIDGNQLNNVASNLRFVLPKQNKHNRKKPSHGKNKYVGVLKVGSQWVARIGEGRSTHRTIGYYPTAEEAAYLRDLEVVKTRDVVNPKDMLNFPNEFGTYIKELLAKGCTLSEATLATFVGQTQ